MDVPLLGRDRVTRDGTRVVITSVFGLRSSAIAHGSPYQKAAALVDLAEDGVGIPEEILDHPRFASSLNSYLFFIQFDFLWSLSYIALILLNFLEKPLWCSEDCSDRDYYFLGQLPYLSGIGNLIYEGVVLLILIFHTLFPVTYEGFSVFWKNHINRIKVLFFLLLIADLAVYAVYLSPISFHTLPFRIAPYVRVFLFAAYFRNITDSTKILFGMLLTYLNVLALWLLFLLFSSWLAYLLFEDTDQGRAIFTSYGTTLYQMFILFTTSNNPDVWIPAYKTSRWYAIFFVLYVLLGVYFVTNLILAVVYDSFKGELVKQVAERDRLRTRILKRAFHLIDDKNLSYLDKDQCIRLLEELNKYRTLPKISREDFELIFYELDDSHDVKICLEEFYDLSNAIGLKFQKENLASFFDRTCPSFYHSPISEKLKNFVRSSTFGYIVMFCLVINFIAVVIETTLDIANNSGQAAWQAVEFVFGWIYVIEMALKIYSYGFLNYWNDGQNRFDFIITWVIVIGESTTFLTPSGVTFLSNGEWIRYLLIARMLRLVRLLLHVQQYRAFVATFLTLIPSLAPYLGTVFCVLCLYCSLGVQIFGGIVNAGNPDLSGTDLEDSDYLLFNFNDYPNGMVTLFNLLVMGSWQVWMQSYKELTGTIWTYAFFISFYLIAVLLLLNLIVAFVLEAFFAEMEIESAGNGETEGTTIRKRKVVGTSSRNQRVDALLHHMLSAELNKSGDAAAAP